MTEESATRSVKMTYDEVKSFVSEHKDPIVATKEVAEQFGVTPQAARYRLEKLVERGEMKSKKMGRSAKGYWVPAESRD